MKKICYLSLAFVAAWPWMVAAQFTSYSQSVEADTFVSSGAPNVNFGSQGAMEIAAPTSLQPRTQMTLLRFDTSALLAAFNADYGAGNWALTSVSLTLFSSVAIAGQQPNNASFNRIAAGAFEFDLLGNNDWSETGITWNTLPGILPGNNGNTLTPLGTFYWDAVGRNSSTWTLNPDLNLVQKIQGGELLTILGQPTAGSTVGYLYNTRTTFNAPILNVTAQAVPEPSTGTLLAVFLGVSGCSRYPRRKN